jgi:predicted nucleic acid-binding protein
VSAGLADTSIFIADEGGRRIDRQRLPDRLAVSIITIGELHAGVLAATDLATRDRRLRTLTAARSLEPILIDERVAEAWGRLRVELRDAGRSMPLNDSWIAATAIAHDLEIVTQDRDFDDVPGIDVVRV